MDSTEQKVIDQLQRRVLADNDLVSCIDCAAVLLMVEALRPLLAILLDNTVSRPVKEHAAHAIKIIGAGPIKEDLLLARHNGSEEIQRLVQLALEAR
jgi:hypothetical protein